MLCRSCLKDCAKSTVRTVILPGDIAHNLPYAIDMCPKCMKEFWKCNVHILAERIDKMNDYVNRRMKV